MTQRTRSRSREKGRSPPSECGGWTVRDCFKKLWRLADHWSDHRWAGIASPLRSQASSRPGRDHGRYAGKVRPRMDALGEDRAELRLAGKVGRAASPGRNGKGLSPQRRGPPPGTSEKDLFFLLTDSRSRCRGSPWRPRLRESPLSRRRTRWPCTGKAGGSPRVARRRS